MTNFERIKNMSQDELIKFLSENSFSDDSVWLKYFNEKYCNTCPAVETKYTNVGLTSFFGNEEATCLCAYCEVNKDCRYFKGQFKDGCPTDEEMLKIWLEAEVNES